MNLQKFGARLSFLLILLGVTILFGCGGGGGGGSDEPSPTAPKILSGVAAVGSPIVNGTVQIKFASGSPLSSTTGNDGAWQVTYYDQTLPCVIEVSGGTINNIANTTRYHSAATDLGTVNVTPMTDLIVANLAAQNPDTWFNELTGTTISTSINTISINTALTNLRTALSGLAPLELLNPITSEFTATAGDPGDDMLTALRGAIDSTNSTYETLRTSSTNIATMHTAFVNINNTLPARYFEISHLDVPTVTNFEPNTGKAGTTISIFGTNFNATPEKNSVRFDGKKAPVVAASPTHLRVTIPIEATTGKITVTTVFGTAKTTEDFTVIPSMGPKLSFSPTFFSNTKSITFPPQNFNTTSLEHQLILFNIGDQEAQFYYDRILYPPGIGGANYTFLTTCSTDDITGNLKLGAGGSCYFGIIQFAETNGSLLNIRQFNQSLGYHYIISPQPVGGDVTLKSAKLDTVLAKVTFTGTVLYPDNWICSEGEALQEGVCVPYTPFIIGISVTSAAPGAEIVITGDNFSPATLNNTVKFNGIQAIVSAATKTSLTVIVPSGAKTGAVTVTTPSGTVTLDGIFTVNSADTVACYASAIDFCQEYHPDSAHPAKDCGIMSYIGTACPVSGTLGVCDLKYSNGAIGIKQFFYSEESVSSAQDSCPLYGGIFTSYCNDCGKEEPTCISPQILEDGICVTPPLTCTAPQVMQNNVCVTPVPTTICVDTNTEKYCYTNDSQGNKKIQGIYVQNYNTPPYPIAWRKTYVDGVLNGQVQSYTESGVLSGEGSYTDGVLLGIWNTYYEDTYWCPAYVGELYVEHTYTYIPALNKSMPTIQKLFCTVCAANRPEFIGAVTQITTVTYDNSGKATWAYEYPLPAGACR